MSLAEFWNDLRAILGVESLGVILQRQFLEHFFVQLLNVLLLREHLSIVPCCDMRKSKLYGDVYTLIEIL